jgi:hypothetical protein
MIFRHLRNARGFFSDYYLGTVFGRGAGRGRRRQLADRETDRAFDRLRRIYERAEGRCLGPSDVREKLARPLLRDILGFHLGAGDGGVHALYPDAAAEAAGVQAIALAFVGGWDEDPDGSPGRGRQSGSTILGNALTRSSIRYGLLITGTQVRLMRRPGDGPRGAYLELDLPGCLESADRESFAAAHRIFAASRFVPADGTLPIEEDERESREHAAKVSEDLKRAVFRAAESLVQGLIEDWASRATPDEQRIPEELGEEPLRVFRDAALTALYRLLFILYAEARDDRLHRHALYRDSYALERLIEEVLRLGPGQLPVNRFGYWAHLVALFRIYDQGLPAIAPWEHLPPRGGDFFSETTEVGRLLASARLDDRTVGQLLFDLTTTVPRQGIGRERVSFRELDIEQLGAVYEGLLEFEPRVARQATLEVSVQGRTFGLSPDDLARLCREKSLALSGDATLVEGTTAETLHPDLAPEDEEPEDEEEPEEADEESAEDEEEGETIRRGASARLIRRLDPGRFFFAPGSARKGSGSFYTPKAPVDDLVRHTLAPLIDGRQPGEIEALRVLDLATGSAHFLVGAMRFMGQALHAAYCREYGSHPPPGFRGTWDTNHTASDEEARAANSEARAWCKRRIAERCLFGVDLNPTAVNLARVSLWIESLAGDRPLTYFEHHIRCGNSLLGTWLDRLGQPPLPGMGAAVDPRQLGLFVEPVKQAIRQAVGRRLLIDQGIEQTDLPPESIEELRYKEDRRREAEEMLAAARFLFDVRSASAFDIGQAWGDFSTLLMTASDWMKMEAWARTRPWWPRFEEVRSRERFFHWELEFPEVFFNGGMGFDVILGNPPWDKVLPTRHEFYARYDSLIRAYKGNDLERRIRELHEIRPAIQAEFEAYQRRTTTVAHLLRRGGDFPLSEARSQAAHEDVSKYFVDRAAGLVRPGGAVGYVVPSVVYNGDGCVGIRRFLLNECAIERFYGFENRKKIFPIHSSYKFVNLVFRKGQTADGFSAAFMRHDLSELEDSGPKPWVVQITRREIETLSPETRAFLEYRGSQDQEIVRRMYEGRPTLDGDGPGSWGATLVSWRAHENIYNASEDKDLFTDPATGRLYTAEMILGAAPSSTEEAIVRMRERGFWPVWEGKHIEQFVVGIKPIRWWLSVEAAERKYGKPPRQEATLVFRETASNTNQRTCLAAVMPPFSAASHKLSGVRLEHVDTDAAATVLNSFCFDFALRLRTAGTSVSFTYMRPMPVPPAAAVNRLPRIPTQLAWTAGIEHITDNRDLWPLLWDANRAVAEAYGLDAADFAHILSAFPVFARKHPDFFAYLRQRLEEWKNGR